MSPHKTPKRPKPAKTPTIPELKPWDIRRLSPTGSATAEEVYQAVGHALSKWEFAETQFSDLYLCFIDAYYGRPYGISPRRAALRAYGSVVSFASRAEIVETAGKVFFNERRRPLNDREANARVLEYEKRVSVELVPLLKELRGFCARRNEIAHGIVGGARGQFYLSPSDFNPRKRPLTVERRTQFESALYHYSADDIDYYRREFERLAQKILDYIERVLRVVTHDRVRAKEHEEWRQGGRRT
jgi:hypothetical protein